MINVKDSPYNAAGDGITDDTAAIQAAYNALANGRGTLYFPAGIYYCASALNFDDGYGTHLQGDSSLWGSIIRFGGTSGSRFISARSTTRFSAENITIDHSSNSFTGYLLDFSHSATTPAVDSGLMNLTRVTLTSTSSGAFPNPGNRFSAIGMNLNSANGGTFNEVFFQGLVYGVSGKDTTVGGYSNAHRFFGCHHGANTEHNYQNICEDWEFHGCTGNPLTNGKPGFIKQTSANCVFSGLTITGGYHGDSSSDGGHIILYAGQGLSISGGFYIAPTDSVFINAQGIIKGLSITGARFEGYSNIVVPQSTATGSTGWFISGNHFENCGQAVIVLPETRCTNYYFGENSGIIQTLTDRHSNYYTAVSNSGTGVTNLMSHTIPANKFLQDGRGARFRAWGTAANNAAAKTVRVNFGGTDVLTYSLQVSAAGNWMVEGNIVRKASNQQTITCFGSNNGAACKVENSSQTKVDTSAIVLQITGQGGATNDITQTGMTVEYL